VVSQFLRRLWGIHMRLHYRFEHFEREDWPDPVTGSLVAGLVHPRVNGI
jgi:hypothetical protein